CKTIEWHICFANLYLLIKHFDSKTVMSSEPSGKSCGTENSIALGLIMRRWKFCVHGFVSCAVEIFNCRRIVSCIEVHIPFSNDLSESADVREEESSSQETIVCT